MADVFGTAAAVLGVIELAAKLASTCLEYTRSVRNAKRDILHLHASLVQLQSIFQIANQICIHNDRLAATKDILQVSGTCFDYLNALFDKLRVSTTGKRLAAKLGRLKWPLQSKEVNNEIKKLDGYRQCVQLALQVDSVMLIEDISKDSVLSKLAWADGATYDAFEDSDESHALCLEDTRVDLFKNIREWIADPEGKSLFWLNGMAGTGKSTISRTLARELADSKQLGASFFFKEGEGDRGSAKRFCTTIAAQLVRNVPILATFVKRALEDDPYIGTKAIKEQFEKLILEPLEKAKEQIDIPVVIVVDALDECKPDVQLETILDLFSRLHELKPLRVRGFLTSRPERVPREGFRGMTPSRYQDLILHEISESVIKHDIAIFLEHRFREICKRRDDLSKDWPGEATLLSLTAKAQPLFVYAATICRFISTGHDPQARLQAILLDEDDQAYDKVHQTYQPILDRLMKESTEVEQPRMLLDFRQIIGPIVVVFDPLTVDALAALLDIDVTRVKLRLEGLHSLLNIPKRSDVPVSPLHLSFPNFLLDSKRRETHRFWLDARDIHKDLAHKCLGLLLKVGCLAKPDICNLKAPGYLRRDVDRSLVDYHLPLEIQYACRYWTYHLNESHCETNEFESSTYTFLEQRFLFWFEALSLLGRVSEMIAMLSHLSALFEKSKNSMLISIIYDARRFLLANSYIADIAPLQLYSSCIIAAPLQSSIRIKYPPPPWLGKVPKTSDTWGLVQQTLIGHSRGVNSVAYTQHGELLASGSNDQTIKLWDTSSGQLLQTLKGHSGAVNSVAFSSDSKLLVSGSGDRTIKLWNLDSGQLQQTLEGHLSSVTSVTFSNSMLLASGSADSTVKVWIVNPRQLILTLRGHTGAINSVAFSFDSKLLASGSFDQTIKIWDVSSGELQKTLLGHHGSVTSVVFAPEGGLLASASGDQTIKLWNVTSGQLLQSLHEHSATVNFVAFSPANSKILASGSLDQTIKLWNIGIEESQLLQTLEEHSSSIKSMAFSPDGKLLASSSFDETVKLWDISLEQSQPQTPQTTRKHSDYITSMAFAPDGILIASGTSNGIMKLWNMDSKYPQLSHTLHGHSNLITSMTFSANGKLLASSSYDGTIKLWDMASLQVKESIPCSGFVRNLSFHKSLPRLETSIGSFPIQESSMQGNVKTARPKGIKNANIKESKNWLVVNGQRILWLPPEYRGLSIGYRGISAVHQNQIAIGTSDGRVLVFQILSNEMDHAGLLDSFEEIHTSDSEDSVAG